LGIQLNHRKWFWKETNWVTGSHLGQHHGLHYSTQKAHDKRQQVQKSKKDGGGGEEVC